MRRKAVITLGGTAGHIYPGEALADQLGSHGIETLCVGGNLSKNRYFLQTKRPYKETACGMLSLRRPLSLPGDLFRILKGTSQSIRVLRSYKPDVVVGFGSYYTFPLLLAALILKIPFVLHEANSIPGKVNRLLSRFAYVTGVQFRQTVRHLKGNAVVVGMPLREGCSCFPVSRSEAVQHFPGLDLKRVTFLVFGGSQGAEAINRLFPDALLGTDTQVIHLTGNSRTTDHLKREYHRQGIASVVRDYERRMDLAWSLADCAICRAGAGTLAEQIALEVPGILIPFPKAAEQHQDKNADLMVELGGAVKLDQSSLTSKKLRTTIANLLAEEKTQLIQMQEAMRGYKRSLEPRDLCSVIVGLIERNKGGQDMGLVGFAEEKIKR